MNVFSTAGVPAGRRASYWNQIYNSHCAQATFEPLREDNFEAELRTGTLGPLGLARVSYNATEIERTRWHIDRTRQRMLSFVLHVRGRALFTHYGHRTVVEDGDFTLSDNGEPHHLEIQDRAEVIILRIPPEMLKTYVPSPKRLCGLRLPADQGFTRTAAAMLRSLADQLDEVRSPEFGHMAARNILEVMATSYAMGFDDLSNCSVAAERCLQARNFIEAHLRKPDLSQTEIAQGVAVSPRYLRMLFAAEGETVSAYILRRRLEESARQLASTLRRGQTITEIALANGFNSLPHFGRSFRQRYGMSAREYRNTIRP